MQSIERIIYHEIPGQTMVCHWSRHVSLLYNKHYSLHCRLSEQTLNCHQEDRQLFIGRQLNSSVKSNQFLQSMDYLMKIKSDAGATFCFREVQGILYKPEHRASKYSSSYHHQSNGQVEVCIKFIKWTLRKCLRPMLSCI